MELCGLGHGEICRRPRSQGHSGLLDFTALPPIKKSKSEVLFCSKPHHLYSDPTSFDGTDLSPILLPNNGFMEVVDRFPYLGDIVSRDGDDTAAVDARVESGGKAFGALRASIFASTSISNKAKKAVYEAIVLSTVLYGCETWSLTEELYRRLRCMHAHHLRAMCRVSRSQAWEHHISTQELGQRGWGWTPSSSTSLAGSSGGLDTSAACLTRRGSLAACSRRGCPIAAR